MGNSFKKCHVVRVRPKPAEIFPMESRILEQVGYGKASKHRRPKCRDIITSMHLLTAFIGNLNSSYRKLSRAGLLLWILSMTVNFMYDGYESRVRYGYPWMFVRGLLWVTCCLGMWFTARRTMPWLEKGLTELERDHRYRKALRDMAGTTKKLPYFLLTFALVSGSLQYGIMQRDQATHLDFGQSPNVTVIVLLHMLRFLSGVHVFYALALFWSVPTCVMLMVGYSMIEYQELTRVQLKDKRSPITLKQAVESYNERVQFVKLSSSACVVLLCTLIMFTVISLALNAYVFLFLNRTLFLYIIHALLPLVLAAYPLSTASWVTKQYHWHLAAVVKAWVECSDSESEDEQPLRTTNGHVIRRIPSGRSEQQALDTSLRIHMPDTGHVTVNPANKDIDRLQNVLRGSARFVGRMQHRRKLTKFNFEKYISYLDKVSKNVGFSIGIVLVTWELVSAVFFFLISLIALFLQESIFGKTESTIKL
ncbi:hypothetical protein ACROYT_G023627 [Oculina patagonica]